MYKLKKIAKKLLPANAKDHVANFYHLLEAVVANIKYGFPGHSAQVIMITGTNGKTTTAAYLIKILEAAGHRVGASTTAFYKVGDKVTVNDQNMTVVNVFKQQELLAEMKKAGCDYMVLEVTSHALVQHRLWGVPCDVAIMTNLTQDHLDYHKTMERYAAAKGKMFSRQPRLIVLNHDDQWFDFFNKFEARERKVTYGADTAATVQITDVALHKNGSDVKLSLDGALDLDFHTNLAGKFNVYNATAAATTGYFLQLDPAVISAGIAALDVVPGRLERVDEGQKFEVFVDYAHTPDALENLLDTLRHLTAKKLILVFGATGNRDRSKRPIMGKIAAKIADRIFVTDEESYDEDPATLRTAILKGIIEAGQGTKATEVADRREAIAAAFKEAKEGDIVVLAGMGHEQFRIMNGQKLVWNEVQVARDLLRKK